MLLDTATDRSLGTPVIAFNRGAVPELLEHDRTGFIVEDERGAVDTIGRLDELDYLRIRERF